MAYGHRDGYLVELAMSGTGFACAFPSAQISVLKRLRRIDLSGSSLVGKCAPGYCTATWPHDSTHLQVHVSSKYYAGHALQVAALGELRSFCLSSAYCKLMACNTVMFKNTLSNACRCACAASQALRPR